MVGEWKLKFLLKFNRVWVWDAVLEKEVTFSSSKGAGHLPSLGSMGPHLPRGLPISRLHK